VVGLEEGTPASALREDGTGLSWSTTCAGCRFDDQRCLGMSVETHGY
jgi:hypothetical protein